MFRCRHWSIAKYFGDAKPQCDKMCDYCTNPQLVRSELSMFQQGGKLGTRVGQVRGDEDTSDLYGGGRRGMKE